jgi:hypothetical protein
VKWYIVVEGRQTEKKVYQSWIEHAFPGVTRVGRIEDMVEGGYFILIGGGYPRYEKRILNAVADIRENSDSFDHLMVCVDAEEVQAEQRCRDVDEIVSGAGSPVTHTVVVHDCCMETWFLGNRRLAKRNPESERLRRYYEFFDVRMQDPESLPAMVPGTPRARFHLEYLRELFRERGLSYSKIRPGEVRDATYLTELVRRVEETDHLRSLGAMLRRWRDLGGQI